MPHLAGQPSAREAPAVVRYGDDPAMARWPRAPSGWLQRRARVDHLIGRPPPLPWAKIGECWAKREHAVTPLFSDA
ncbi:MAG: hypothetical protein ACRDXB_11775 [Actinomycetes bacterium]